MPSAMPAVATMHASSGSPRQQCPAAAGAPPAPSAWGRLGEHLVLLIVQHLNPEDLAAAHRVSRVWRDATRLTTRSLAFSRKAPDTERIKLYFPSVTRLALNRMELSPQAMACIAGLTGLTSLHLKMCQINDGGSITALQQLRALQELELCEVAGPSAEAVDDALRTLTNLHRLHVESHSVACRAPSLRSLAFLPRIRQLAVKQARPWQGFVGLTNLQVLQELQALELHGAGVTNSIMRRLAALEALTQLCVPEAFLVTDHGLEALAGLTALKELDVSCLTPQADEPVTDAGVAHMAQLCALTSLSLAGRTAVTGQGLAFLGACTGLHFLDLSGVRLDSGSGGASFLWHLTQLTCLRVGGTQVPADQITGLSTLTNLAELNVSGTGFNDACCAQLAQLSRLQRINLARTGVTSSGINQLNACHGSRLKQLRLDGCPVSMLAVLGTLRRQPGTVCMWDEGRRGHMPRWVNVANTLLMVADDAGRARLRLRHAPEARWHQQAAMAAAASGMLLAYFFLLLATMVLLFSLPAVGFFTFATLLLVYASGQRVASRPLLLAIARAEILLSAVLVGVLSIQVPPPPADLLHPWHW